MNIVPNLDSVGLEVRKQALGKVVMSVMQQARDADLRGALPAGNALQTQEANCVLDFSTPGWKRALWCLYNKILIANNSVSLPLIWKGQLDAIHASTKHYRKARQIQALASL